MQYFFAFSFCFFKLLCLRSPFPRLQGNLNSSLLQGKNYFLEEGWILSSFCFCPPKVGPVVCASFIQAEIFAQFLHVCFSPDRQGWVRCNPVCWWLGLYFCFVCCLDEASWTGCYWWLGDAGSYIQVFSFVWVLTIWYSLVSRGWRNLVVWSQWWESERRKEANIPWVMQPAFTLQGISQKEKKREREKERKTLGPKVWWSKGALLNSIRVYIPVASLDKDQETRLYKFTKEARSNRGHKANMALSISKQGHK